MPERHRGDQRAEADARRSRRQRRKRGPGVERPPLGGMGERLAMVRSEEGIEAVLLARQRQRDPLLPRHSLLTFDQQTDPHAHAPFYRATRRSTRATFGET